MPTFIDIKLETKLRLLFRTSCVGRKERPAEYRQTQVVPQAQCDALADRIAVVLR